MKKILISLSAVLCFICIFHSCKKGKSINIKSAANSTNDEQSVAPPSGYSTIHDYRTEIRKITGKALAKAMVKKELRDFIKKQVTIQLQGETEFLYAQKYSTIIADGKTLAQILDENSPKDLSYFTNDLPYYDPYLTILIPDDYEPENWNTSNLIPNVASSPSGWNDADPVNVPLYNNNGQVEIVSSEEQPELLTVIIGESERLTAFLKPCSVSNNPPYFENETYIYFENSGIVKEENKTDYISNNHYVRTPNNRGCDRDNNTTKPDMMGSLNINGKAALKTMESWIKGKAELVYHLVYNGGTPTNKSMVDIQKRIPSISRKQAKNSVSIAVNIEHMIWGNVLQMEKYYINFAERDGNKKKKERACGQQEVQYCTPALGSGTTFNTGLVTFNIHF